MEEYTVLVCTHVATAITANPIIEASRTRHPNCSRMGIRILTITLRGVAGCSSDVLLKGATQPGNSEGIRNRSESHSGTGKLTDANDGSSRGSVQDVRIPFLAVGYRRRFSWYRGRSEEDLDATWSASRRGQARWSECTVEATTPEAARRARFSGL
jgi:hypothetical protein